MTTEEALQVFKNREEKLKARIAKDRLEAKKLRYKSKAIRHSSPLHNRIGWFTDRLQELQLVIKFIEGGVSAENFIIHKNGDGLDIAITFYSDNMAQ